MTVSPRFQFNKRLWQRFIKTAQPYFFPVAPGQTRIFLGLILVLFLAVISLTLLIAVGLLYLGETFFPDLVDIVAQDLIKAIGAIGNSPAPYFAVGVLIIAGLIFTSQRDKVRERWLPWVLLGLLLFLIFDVTQIEVLFSYVTRLLNTALNQRNEDIFWQNITIFCWFVVLAIPILVLDNYLTRKLGLLWREWLTKHFLNLYFRQRAYYQIDANSVNPEVDNPDQRITQDVRAFTDVTLKFILEIIRSIVTLIAFIAVLYSISKALTWGLLAYALLGNIIVILSGTQLININYNQFRLEANFRYGMVRVRDNAESIAFYQGEDLEKQRLIAQLVAAIRNFDLLIIWESVIMLFQYFYGYIGNIVPYMLLAPLYFQRELELGTIFQGTFAFSRVLDSLAIIINQIQQVTEFAASINRLGEFYEFLEDPVAIVQLKQIDPQIQVTHIDYQSSPQVRLEGLTLKTPNFARTLVKDLSVSVPPQGSLLVMGASGSGKSSILRAIAELWTSGTGMIYRPPLAEMLFLPQRPYMIIGTLREQLLYPNLAKDTDDDELQAILETVNLPDLVGRFKQGFATEENWQNILSLGEQQRVAFARILVTQPRYAILDESTSALDVDNEKALYERLSRQGTTYISVGHRPTLKEYHQQLLTIIEGGEWEIQTMEK